MAGTLVPYFEGQWFDNNGDPLAGGKVYTYAAGTTTNLATYSDSALSVANANPVILDSAGRAVIYLSAASYKIVLKTSADVTILTQDNVAAIPFLSLNLDIDGTAGEALSAGDAVYLSDGSGGNTAGRWYKTDADFTYASTSAQALGFAVAAIASAASGSIRVAGRMTGLSGLTSGAVEYLSATAGALTTSAPTNARAIGVADSTTSIVLSPFVTAPVASATLAGIVSLSAQTLGAGDKTMPAALIVTKQTTTGVGGGTATAKVGGVISWNATSASNTNAGAETDLMTYSLPAGTLDGTNAFAVRVTFTGTLGAAAETKRIRFKFGATTILDLTSAASATTTRFSGQVTITRLSATTQGAAGWIQERDGGLPTSDFDSSNPGETLANAITIKLTGLSATASQITQTSMLVEVP